MLCFLKKESKKGKKQKYLHSVGFEPTNLSISDLESDALDHSAMNAATKIIPSKIN